MNKLMKASLRAALATTVLGTGTLILAAPAAAQSLGDRPVAPAPLSDPALAQPVPPPAEGEDQIRFSADAL
ncbi:hypothetical protein, partial [Clostridium perfringens]